MPKQVEFEGQIHEFPDDFTDAEISSALKAIPAANAATSPQAKTWTQLAGDVAGTAEDVAIGAGKRLVETGVRGGALLRKIPGIEWLSEKFPSVNVPITPTSTAQKIGGALEQGAELLAPSRAVTSAGLKAAEILGAKGALGVLPRMAVEGAGSAGLAAAQGASPGGAVAAGVIGAAIPGASGYAEQAAAGLKSQAEKLAVQALGPTKERFKAMAQKIAPEVIRRGLGGSREALKDISEGMVKDVGSQIDEAIQQYGTRASDTSGVLAALEAAKEPFRTTRTMSVADAAKSGLLNRPGVSVSGTTAEVPVIFDKRPIEQISSLQGILQDLGPNPRVDQLVAVRRAWDSVVSQVGGYAQRAPGAIGVPLAEQSEAWAKRKGANAIRSLLDQDVPELSAINKEFSFWKSLDDVLGQTLKRTQPQGPGLGKMAAEAAGQVVGGVAGSGAGPLGTVGGALTAGKVAAGLTQVFRSPRWKFVDAKLRDSLADALISGSQQRVLGTMSRIAAIEGATLGREPVVSP